MSTIARAFTTRKVKMSIELAQEARNRAEMQRANTTKAPVSKATIGKPAPVKEVPTKAAPTKSAPAKTNQPARPTISGPVELVHTTNMLSYNAPDIFPRPGTSTSSVLTKSDDDSNSDRSPTTAASSPPTSPDVAPDDRSISPEPNHLSCYFVPPQPANPPRTILPPAIPQRAPSHTKKASFEAMGRQRSNSRLSNQSGKSVSTKASFTFSRSSSASTSASTISYNSMSSPIPKMPSTPVTPLPAPRIPYEARHEEPKESHPFGQELAQVSRIAEEYGVSQKLQVIDEEEQELAARGLRKFSADVYLGEIQSLAASFFRESTQARPMAAVWI